MHSTFETTKKGNHLVCFAASNFKPTSFQVSWVFSFAFCIESKKFENKSIFNKQSKTQHRAKKLLESRTFQIFFQKFDNWIFLSAVKKFWNEHGTQEDGCACVCVSVAWLNKVRKLEDIKCLKNVLFFNIRLRLFFLSWPFSYSKMFCLMFFQATNSQLIVNVYLFA